MRCTKSLKAI